MSSGDLLPSATTIGYLGDPWISAHIDDLRPSFDTTVIPSTALGLSISELFMGKVLSYDGSNKGTASPAPQCQTAPLHRRLQDCIQASTLMLEDVTWKRAIRRIKILIDLLSKGLPTPLGKIVFFLDNDVRLWVKVYL